MKAEYSSGDKLAGNSIRPLAKASTLSPNVMTLSVAVGLGSIVAVGVKVALVLVAGNGSTVSGLV